MIQAIVYDAVGTLMHVDPSVEAVYAEVGRRYGTALAPAEIRRRFAAAFAEQEQLDRTALWRTSEERERERWRAIVARVLDDVNDPAACFESLYGAFAQPGVWAFDPDWHYVSVAIRARGIRQAVASNFDHRLHALIAAISDPERIERVIVSSEVGWRKPAPEFFAHVSQAMDLRPSEILFVGDDRANDYEPALAAGMDACLLDAGKGLREILQHV